MKKTPFTVCVVLLLSSCAAAPVREVSYQHVAEELVAVNGCEPQYCVGAWYPVERPESKEIAEQQKVLAVSDCVSKLEKNIQDVRAYFGPPATTGLMAGRAPNDAVAAAQLVACMREKGWQYYVDGMLVWEH